MFGLPKPKYSEVVAPGTLKYPKDPADTQEWYIEQALDLEWAHAVAPRAKLVYVGAANDTKGLDQALNEVVDQHLADVVSNSWGIPESLASKGEVKALNSVFQQAQAEGIAMVFASGDDGDNLAAFGTALRRLPRLQPAGDVGGRHQPGHRLAGPAAVGDRLGHHRARLDRLALDRRVPRRLPLRRRRRRQPHLRRSPSYQDGIVPGTMRAEPDVALVADPQTGVLFTQTYSKPNGGTEQKESWIGGTSLSAPLMAGLATLADQASGRPHGFLNPSLYRLAGSARLQRHHAQRPAPGGAPPSAAAERQRGHHAALARPRQLAGHGARLGRRSPVWARPRAVALVDALR